MNKTKLKKVGNLWKKDKGEKPFYAGPIEVLGQQIQLLVFKNEYKEDDAQPDWTIYVREEVPDFVTGDDYQ